MKQYAPNGGKPYSTSLLRIEERSGKRFDGVESSITRIETILISVAGTIIVAGAGGFIPCSLCKEKIMDIDYDKKDMKESPKVKSAPKKKPELPEGWHILCKTGNGLAVVDPNGKQLNMQQKKQQSIRKEVKFKEPQQVEGGNRKSRT